jgi:hypothetical protein
MKIRELLSMWEKTAAGELTRETFAVRLPVEDAARIHALAEMFPRRSREELITDLLTAALSDLESAMPYERGNNVVALDEEGDPLYEDIGPTPQYLTLIRKYLTRYKQTPDGSH